MYKLKKKLIRFTIIKYIHRALQRYNSYLQGLPKISYDSITKELIQNLINKPNPTIIEIGCNNGIHTQWFLDSFKSPKVFCFEPDPRAIKQFKKNIGANTNVKLFELAISDRNGYLTFYQSSGKDENNSKIKSDDWSQSGSIRQPYVHLKEYPQIKFEKSLHVKTLTLDTWCTKNGIDNIDFIWMDVQGAEKDVFAGGLNAISKTRFLYTEYSNKQLYKGQYNLKQILKKLEQFEVIYRYPSDLLIKNKSI